MGEERGHQNAPGAALGEQAVLTVSEVNGVLRALLEEAVPEITFKGEIGEVKSGKTGHVYFTIKDETSQVAAVMWAGVYSRQRLKLVPGLAVQVSATPTVYPARGSLQFIVHRIAEQGAGTLQKKFLELKAKLETEGLFNPARKRRLPFIPRAIGVVTSANGAVIHDIMHRVQERFPSIPVVLIDVRVQGEGSAAEIAKAIAQMNRDRLLGLSEVDVLIVGRGGGSLEDLWSFNEEIVVRAVYASALPVVSAVGHETDITLCDLVADVRAPTPTAAAEVCVPRRDDLLRRVSELGARLLDAERVLAPLEQRLDEVALRLDRAVMFAVERQAGKVSVLEHQVRAMQPQLLLNQAKTRVAELATRLRQLAQFMIERRSAELTRHEVRLVAIDPKAVLKRGYAVVRSGTKAVRSHNDVSVGDNLSILIAQGEIGARVTKI